MTLPALLFGIVLSSAYGAAFHVWKGGSLRRLVLYLLFAWLGFWSGHFLAAALEWRFFEIGPLHAGPATLGAVLVLLVGDWLSRIEVTRP
ncbi:MAG: hypothetical protein N2049_08510 [Anaerolineales bacterium]|nr:hypothetical protein [Anaerolineales bacterium]MDW8228013.1 hypothetical protein [Anaerolineales bacterium]